MWDLAPATYDSVNDRLVASVDHFSYLTFVRVDVSDAVKSFTDAFESAFDLSVPRPSCAGKPATVDGVKFSVDARYSRKGDGIVWPCLSASDGAVDVTLTNATGLPWLIRSKPKATVSERGTVEVEKAILLALYRQYLNGGKFSQSMVIPGGANTYRFSTSELPGFIDLKLDGFAHEAMALLWALHFLLDLFYPQAEVAIALEKAGTLTCISHLVSTATGKFDGRTAGSFAQAFFSCANHIVLALGGQLTGVFKVVIAAFAGGISLAMNGMIGAWRSATSTDHTSVNIDKSPPPILGDWFVHGGTLRVRPDYTATAISYNFACGPVDSDGFPTVFCNQYTEFVVMAAGSRSIKLVVKKISLRDSSGKTYPLTDRPLGRVGDYYVMKLLPRRRATTELHAPTGALRVPAEEANGLGNPNLCPDGDSNSDGFCGQ